MTYRLAIGLATTALLAGCGGQSPDEALDVLKGYCSDGSTGSADARKAVATINRDGSSDQKISAALLLYCDERLSRTIVAKR